MANCVRCGRELPPDKPRGRHRLYCPDSCDKQAVRDRIGERSRKRRHHWLAIALKASRDGPTAIIARVALAAAGLLATDPAAAHDWYVGLRTPTGGDCCGDRDCRPVELCDGGRGLALPAGCTPIPWQSVIPTAPPDGRDHACVTQAGVVLCVILGGQT